MGCPWQVAKHPSTCSFTPNLTLRQGREKVRKFLGRQKGNLKSKGKRKEKKWCCSPLSTSRKMACHFLLYGHSPRPIFPIIFYAWAWHTIFFWPFQFIHPIRVHSQPLGHLLAYLLGGQSRKKRRPSCYAYTTQQQPKHWWVTNTILVTSSKHSISQAAVKK